MKKKFILTVFFISNYLSIFSQVNECGTPDTSDAEMQKKAWVKNQNYLDSVLLKYEFYNNSNLRTQSYPGIAPAQFRVPITFILAGTTANRWTEVEIQNELDILNEIHRQNYTGFQFYKTLTTWNIDYPDNIDDNNECALVNSYRSQKMIIVFPVNHYTAAGSYFTYCDFNYYPTYDDNIILNFNRNVGRTLAHEIGHYFELEHTHRNSKDGNQCNSEAVDHTRELEFWGCGCVESCLICSIRGDFLCDTPADPELDGNNVNSTTCVYVDQGARDAWASPYSPDTRNMMSYSPGNCRNHFTPGQIGVMVSNINDRSDYDDVDKEKFMFDIYEPDNTLETAREISFYETQHHTYHWQHYLSIEAKDEDWLKFEINAASNAGIVEINTEQAYFTNAETEMRLYFESESNEIAYDENSGGFDFIHITLKNPAYGTYFIKITFKGTPPANSISDYFVTLDNCVQLNACYSKTVPWGYIPIINTPIDGNINLYGLNTLSIPCSGYTFLVRDQGVVKLYAENEINMVDGFETTDNASFETFLGDISVTHCSPIDLGMRKARPAQNDFTVASENVNNEYPASPSEPSVSENKNPEFINETLESSLVNIIVYDIMGIQTMSFFLSNKPDPNTIKKEILKRKYKPGVYVAKIHNNHYTWKLKVVIVE